MADYDGRASIGGRLRRYGQTAGAVSGFAARYVGNRYLGMKSDTSERARELREALGGIKGPLMKAAQMLATLPDAVPDEYVAELSQLQADAPPMGWPFVKRRMTTELGSGWQDRFAAFSREAAHAASLGQVHRARLHDGREVAAKLQYPDMKSAVEADLQQLRWVLQLWERYDKALSTRQIHQELSDRLHEELDYSLEARHARLFRHMLAEEPTVHVPEVIDELSTDRLITMEWVYGAKLMDIIDDLDQEARNTIARNLFRAWYVPFYQYGVIHGDPHLGNYTVRPDQGYDINLFDFGCIRMFGGSFVRAVIDLYEAIRDDDDDKAVHAYETWGFTGLKREAIETLNMWARFVYQPLMEDRVRAMDETNSSHYGREVAQEVHKKLREVGGVEVPREFVFMDRAAIGLGSVFLRLKAEVNWHREFLGLTEDLAAEAVQQRQDAALAEAGLESRV